MARVRDLPLAIRHVGIWTFLKRLWKEIMDDQVFTWAAALSYSWLFAVFPFFLFMLSLVPLLPDNAKTEIKEQLGVVLLDVLPKDAHKTIWDDFLKGKLDAFLEKPKAAFMSVGAILAIWGASGGISMTMTALDRCYDLDRSRAYYKHRGIAIVLTMVTATLMLSIFVLVPLASLAIGVFLAYAQARGVTVNVGLLAVIQVVRYFIALLLAITALAVVFYFGTAIRTRWRWITPGILFTLGMWIFLSLAFRFYINAYGRYEQTYGAVGGVVVLLLLFYLDALMLLIGAEIDSEVNAIAYNGKPGQMDYRGVPWKHLQEKGPVDPAFAAVIKAEEAEEARERAKMEES